MTLQQVQELDHHFITRSEFMDIIASGYVMDIECLNAMFEFGQKLFWYKIIFSNTSYIEIVIIY